MGTDVPFRCRGGFAGRAEQFLTGTAIGADHEITLESLAAGDTGFFHVVPDDEINNYPDQVGHEGGHGGPDKMPDTMPL